MFAAFHEARSGWAGSPRTFFCEWITRYQAGLTAEELHRVLLSFVMKHVWYLHRASVARGAPEDGLGFLCIDRNRDIKES